MMVAASVQNGQPATSRIPAWKRLGLELKFAKELDEEPAAHDGALLHSLKRSVDDRSHISNLKERSENRVTKKRRIDPPLSSVTLNGSTAPTSKSSMRSSSPILRKKVSFSDGTKLQDGDSSKTLISDWEEKNAFIEQQLLISEKIDSDRAEAAAKLRSEGERLVEKPPAPVPHKSVDALHYLDQYHSSRSKWKFNKNRDIWILKHILSSDIPRSYDVILAAYVRGLQSERTRSRLVDECNQALQHDESYLSSTTNQEQDMEDPARQRAYEEDAVRRFKRNLEESMDEEDRNAQEQDPEFQQWLSRRKRAELLLWAMNVAPSASSSNTPPSTNGQVQSEQHSSAGAPKMNGILSNKYTKKPTNRKNRTSVVEDSTSSEDDSDGSDDEEASDSDNNSDQGNATSSSHDSSDASTDVQDENGSSEVDDSSSSDDQSSKTASSLSRERQPSAITISSDSSDTTMRPRSTTSATSATSATSNRTSDRSGDEDGTSSDGGSPDSEDDSEDASQSSDD